MTLDEMIQQCALDIDETLSKSNGAYVGDTLVLVTKILSGLNYAYHKLAREKNLVFEEKIVTLDSDKMFFYSALINTPIKILGVQDADNNAVDWQLIKKDTVYCAYRSESDALTVRYTYLPTKLVLTSLTDEPLLPVEKVDHTILCHYADFYTLSLEPDNVSQDKSIVFLSLFNNEFEEIQADFNQTFTFREVPWG